MLQYCFKLIKAKPEKRHELSRCYCTNIMHASSAGKFLPSLPVYYMDAFMALFTISITVGLNQITGVLYMLKIAATYISI